MISLHLFLKHPVETREIIIIDLSTPLLFSWKKPETIHIAKEITPQRAHQPKITLKFPKKFYFECFPTLILVFFFVFLCFDWGEVDPFCSTKVASRSFSNPSPRFKGVVKDHYNEKKT